MPEDHSKKSDLKQKIMEQVRLFFIYFVYLALIFISLATYQRLILGEYGIPYISYGFALINALILSKVILLGQDLKLGEKYEDKPLFIPTLYKTLVFCVFVFVFVVIEHFIEGAIHGHPFEKVYDEFISKGINEILAKILVLFFVFIIFFGILELGRVLGMDKLWELFFIRNTKNDRDSGPL